MTRSHVVSNMTLKFACSLLNYPNAFPQTFIVGTEIGAKFHVIINVGQDRGSM